MNRTARGFTIGFVSSLIVTAFLNLLPYLRTHGAYNGDGFEVIGFPLAFRRVGGFTGIYEFSILSLLADIGVALALALFVGYLFSKVYQSSRTN